MAIASAPWMIAKVIAPATRLGHLYFPAYSARCPNRAATVRAHNWVVLGALYTTPVSRLVLPATGRLYFRKSQLQARPTRSVPDEMLSWPWRCFARKQQRPGRGWRCLTAPSPSAVWCGAGAAPPDTPRIDFLTGCG